MKIILSFLSLSVIASAAPGDQRIEWWNESNSRQDTLINVADISKPSLIVGLAGNNKPVSANLGTGLVHDAVGKLISVDFAGYATIATLSGYVTTGNFTWSNLGGKPTLFDGQYGSLTGVPSTFTPSAHTHVWTDIVSGKPTTLSGYGITDGVTTTTLSGYATNTALTTGLAGKLDTTSFTWSSLTGKPTFAAVATSGSYLDLSNRPTIPAAQVQTDWNASTGIGVILNKPSTFPPSAHNQAWSTITSTPTTLSGYGITDAYPLSGNPSAFVNQSGARSAISVTTTGSGAATYNSGTGVLNIPTPATSKRQEAYSGTTNASGQYTVTFGTAYAVAPNIQAGLINGADNQNLRVTSITTTGFTVLARNRVDVVGLLPTWTNVSGIGIDVLITEK